MLLFKKFSPLILCLLLVGCFTPLHSSSTGSTLPYNVKIQSDNVSNKEIVVITKNELLPKFTPSNQDLIIILNTSTTSSLLDRESGRPIIETITLSADISIIDNTSNVIIYETSLVSKASINSSEQQRFARARAVRNAQTLAAKQLANNILTQLRLRTPTQ